MQTIAFLAYIDPGTGTLLLQMIIAGVMGAGVFFRKTVLRLFGRGGDRNDAVSGSQPTDR